MWRRGFAGCTILARGGGRVVVLFVFLTCGFVIITGTRGYSQSQCGRHGECTHSTNLGVHGHNESFHPLLALSELVNSQCITCYGHVNQLDGLF